MSIDSFWSTKVQLERKALGFEQSYVIDTTGDPGTLYLHRSRMITFNPAITSVSILPSPGSSQRPNH